MSVAYLGPVGSFTHAVAVQVFSKEVLVPFETITEVLQAYQRKEVRWAIVPVENSIEGSVHETTDFLFHEANSQVVAEVIQPIKQQLMTAGSLTPEVIFSHPQALAQGKKYLKLHYPKARFETTTSTAFAARFIAEHSDQPYGAIAPKEAAEQYGLTIIAQDIQEIDDNYTRFWILGEKSQTLSIAQMGQKLSLALTLPDNLPGALYKGLSVFAWRGIDLTKIESRPLKTMLGEYFFIIDIDNTAPNLVQFALEELTSLGISYKLLGDYPIYKMTKEE